MARVYNFSAGPATLPTEVLQQAQAELLDYHALGYSIMETSHRSQSFLDVVQQTEADCRELLDIPQHYKILFLPGGGQGQFATIPMNLFGQQQKADYVISGLWSKMAAQEASKYGQVNVIASSDGNQYTTLPTSEKWSINADSAYCYYCDNETINGIQFQQIPKIDVNVPLVCDMSSSVLSKPFDINRFGLVFACVQKNLGPAGVTLVIIREDLLGNALTITPSVLNYTLQANKDSLLNTPCTFAWYMVGLILQWLKRQGGLTVIAQRNQEKAQKLYDFIDQSDFYFVKVEPNCRSLMNVVFYLKDESLSAQFLQQATQAGLANLKGHRAVGGMRASLYNAMPLAGVDKLIGFMQSFETALK